jgi:hypothetical protein
MNVERQRRRGVASGGHVVIVALLSAGIAAILLGSLHASTLSTSRRLLADLERERREILMESAATAARRMGALQQPASYTGDGWTLRYAPVAPGEIEVELSVGPAVLRRRELAR